MSKTYWILTISNDRGKSRKVCTGIACNNMLLKFESEKPAHKFKTDKEAWYFWYKFRTHYPDRCQGYYAKVLPRSEEITNELNSN